MATRYEVQRTLGHCKCCSDNGPVTAVRWVMSYLEPLTLAEIREAAAKEFPSLVDADLWLEVGGYYDDFFIALKPVKKTS